MALFEDEELTEATEEENNTYLFDSRKGFFLMKSLLKRQEEKKDWQIFESILHLHLFPLIADLDIINETEIYRCLNKLSDKLKDSQKIRLLHHKKVVGIGGKFSSGKSCFINSLTKSNLPEGQRPTTSIATFILRSDAKKTIAITNNDRIITLDDEALTAITHRFYEQYHIGFAKIIQNLVVFTDEFPYSNVAILDTPGYSKADQSKEEDSSDAELAREQLRSVDYLIWLVDSEQGVITQHDLEFISSLNLSTEILVVFTKAGLVTKENLIKKIDQAKISLAAISEKIFGVIAYDSLFGETVIGGDELERFMKMADENPGTEGDLHQQLLEVYNMVANAIDTAIIDKQSELHQLSYALENTCNIEHISSIIREYSYCHASIDKLKLCKKKNYDLFDSLVYIVKQMTGGKNDEHE